MTELDPRTMAKAWAQDKEPPRTFLATFPDGSQVLVTEWATGRSEVAKRRRRWSVWGPPSPLETAT